MLTSSRNGDCWSARIGSGVLLQGRDPFERVESDGKRSLENRRLVRDFGRRLDSHGQRKKQHLISPAEPLGARLGLAATVLAWSV